MRRTSAYHFAAITAVLVILFLGATFDNATLAIILGIVAAIVVYKVVIVIENALSRGVNKMIYSGSSQLVDELLNDVITFETSADREEIALSLYDIYPFERPAIELKSDWICNRVTENNKDYLIFAIGVRTFSHAMEVINSENPYAAHITIAKLFFQSVGDNTGATFAFVSRIEPNDGKSPHSKQMLELVGTIKDTFMRHDSDCKITENKGVCV